MLTTTETLLTEYHIDTAHARHVADLALQLFDASKERYDLPQKRRRLLETGALLHNIGLHIDERKHNQVGRDILLSISLDDYSDDERAMLACLVLFHRKKVRPRIEAAFLRLGKRDGAVVLQLAALLRIADGLDSSQSQSTVIDTIIFENDDLHLALSGPHAHSDGARATEKANLWQKVFAGELRVQAEPPITDEHTSEQEVDTSAGDDAAAIAGSSADDELDVPHITASPDTQIWRLSAEDTLPDAARKVLRRYFQKLLECEKDVHDSDDPEAIHDMRVATRRLRATLDVLGSALGAKRATRFRQQLRSIAQTLGTVRDSDVFLGHAQQYSEGSEGSEGSMAPLTDALLHDRARARARLLRTFASSKYTHFKHTFAHFVTTSDASVSDAADPKARVRYAAGSAIWHSYEQLRVYETVVPLHNLLGESIDLVALHQMRIAGKHFRYTLELFSEALGPKVDQVLEPLLKLQDHLGSVQDIEVATAYVQELAPSPADQQALDAYIATRHADQQHLLNELPRAWEKVASATFRRRLMELIVKL